MAEKNSVYLCAPVNALVEGIYEEKIPFSKIKAGFYTPDFMSSISVPGMHLHFLSTDQQHGGHLLECRPHQARVSVQVLDDMELGLPMSDAYLQWDFHRDVGKDLDKAEK